jgi:hypothetical protein
MTAHKGFDSAVNLTDVIDDIPDDVDFACRYYSHSAWKNLTAAEALALAAAEIAIVSVWESAGNHADFFSDQQGRADVSDAVELAKNCGQPEGTAIYFAVDTDVTTEQFTSNILPYFRAVSEEIGGKGHVGGYVAGVYGSGYVCQQLLDLKLVKYAWLACAGGWLGTRQFTGWHIKQSLPADPYGFGFQIDPDVSSGDDYGQWTAAAPATV